MVPLLGLGGPRLQSSLSKTSGQLRLGRLDFASFPLRDEPVANWRRGLLAPGLLTSLQVVVFCSVNPISWQRLMGEVCDGPAWEATGDTV